MCMFVMCLCGIYLCVTCMFVMYVCVVCVYVCVLCMFVGGYVYMCGDGASALAVSRFPSRDKELERKE